MQYGNVKALDNVSFRLNSGEAVAVLGPNGAGKTTSVRLLTGVKKTQQGKATLFGKDPQRPKARALIGVTPQEAAFQQAQKVGEILDFVQAHYRHPAKRSNLIDAFDLANLENRMATDLSGGQQRRLAVALAFCGSPRIVFLDEPTTGIDVAARKKIWEYIQRYKNEGGSVFLTTHYLEEAEKIADRIIVLEQGRVAATGTVQELKNVIDVRIVRFSADQRPQISSAHLQFEQHGHYHFMSSDADETVRELVASGLPFRDLEVLPAKLEDAVGELLKDKA